MSLFEARHQFFHPASHPRLHCPPTRHRYSTPTTVAAADVPVSSRPAVPQGEGCVTDRPSPQHNIRSCVCPLHASQTLRPDNPIGSASPENKSLTCSRHADLPSLFLVYTITSNFLNYPPSLKFQVKRPPASPSPPPECKYIPKKKGTLDHFTLVFIFHTFLKGQRNP